jgi:hypothetical protein
MLAPVAVGDAARSHPPAALRPNRPCARTRTSAIRKKASRTTPRQSAHVGTQCNCARVVHRESPHVSKMARSLVSVAGTKGARV